MLIRCGMAVRWKECSQCEADEGTDYKDGGSDTVWQGR